MSIERPNKKQLEYMKQHIPAGADPVGWQMIDNETVRFWYEHKDKKNCILVKLS